MDPEPEVIRRDIDRTRESLTEKLETLEGQVRETIGTVRSKVEGTVEAVTSSVENSVRTVKETFDLPEQVRRHPHAMVGGALVTGALVGWLVTGRREGPRHGYPRHRPTPLPPAPSTSVGDGRSQFAAQPEPEGPGLMSRLLEPLAGEFDRIKATAIGALMAMARDAIRRNLPESLAPNVEEILDNITRRAGGEVIHGPVLPPAGSTPAPGPAGHNY
jgi:hypothetical protein